MTGLLLVDRLVTEVTKSGDDLIVRFTGPSGVDPGLWLVRGSTSIGSFPDDRTGDTTIVESPADLGSYQATIDLGTTVPRYFVRIEPPE